MSESMKEHLKRFIENIEIKSVNLKKLSFYTKEAGQNQEANVEIKLSIRPKLEKDGKVEFIYTHKENIVFENNKLYIEIVYRLAIEFRGDAKTLKRNLLMAYAKNSGLLVVYPYIRHLSDIIKREAGFIFSPLPHALIK